MRVLIFCTGNSCRSQMAEGFLKSFDHNLEVFSAGTEPANEVNPYAIRVMSEIGIDISKNKPQKVDKFLNDTFDYVITVCDNAKETCPVFSGTVIHKLHIGFKDPALTFGGDYEVMDVFQTVRDQIQMEFREFYRTKILIH